MSGIIFLSDNFIDDADISLTTGTENAQFPLTNIQNESSARKFRSQENDVVIVFDMQQTRTIDSVAISGDMTNDLGLTVASIKLSLTTDFSGATAIPVTLSAEHIMGYEFFTSDSARYMELTLSGTGSFAEVSNVFLGEKIDISTNNLSIGSFQYANNDLSSVSKNRYGTRFVDKRNAQKTLGGSIEFANLTEQEDLDDLFIYHGINRPIWAIVDQNSEGMNDGKYKLTIYGYFTDSPSWAANGGRNYTASVEFEAAV